MTAAAGHTASTCSTLCSNNSACKYYVYGNTSCTMYNALTSPEWSYYDTYEPASSCDNTVTFIEPSTADYTAALSTVYVQNTGSKEYTLPVWSTSDAGCGIESYLR